MDETCLNPAFGLAEVDNILDERAGTREHCEPTCFRGISSIILTTLPTIIARSLNVVRSVF